MIQIFLFAFFERASILSPSGKECDQDFSVRALALSIGATNSLAFKKPMRSRFFCSRFCERASIRSPSGNHLHPPFSLAGGEPGRRGDHFWVRSRVELNLEALACHPRTSKERTRAPWNVFFLSFHVFVFFFLASRVETVQYVRCYYCPFFLPASKHPFCMRSVPYARYPMDCTDISTL